MDGGGSCFLKFPTPAFYPLAADAHLAYSRPVATTSHKTDPWIRGVYLIPDAAQILRIPAASLRTWITGRNESEQKYFPAGEIGSDGVGLDRHRGQRLRGPQDDGPHLARSPAGHAGKRRGKARKRGPR